MTDDAGANLFGTRNAPRDAPHLFAGVAYQKLVTLCAWLALGPDDVLYVETGEDHAVQSGAKAEQVQIKRVAQKLTLADKGARAAIASAFAAEAGISTLFYTTASPGADRGLGGVLGVDLWAKARSGDRTAAKTLQAHLAKRAAWPKALRAVIKGSDVQAFVDKVVMRLDWATDRPGIDRSEAALRTALRQRIEVRYREGAAAAAGLLAPRALNRIETLARQVQRPRSLCAADLEELIDEVVSAARTIATLNLPGGGEIGHPASTPSAEVDRLKARLSGVAKAAIIEVEDHIRVGRSGAAAEVLDRWIADSDGVESEVQASLLRLRVDLHMVDGDAASAKALLDRADSVATPPDRRSRTALKALDDLEGAINDLSGRLSDDERLLKAELLVRLGRGGDALTLLPEPPAHAPESEAFVRVRALAMGSEGDLDAALTLVDGRRRTPEAYGLLVLAATFRFSAGHAKGVTVSMTEWPDPTPSGLVRSDPKSRERFLEAADLFERLSDATDDPDLKRGWRVWKLAALTNVATARDRAVTLATELLALDRPPVGAIHWSQARALGLDVSAAEARLEARVLAQTADVEELIACVLVRLRRNDDAGALAFLEDHASLAVTEFEQDAVRQWAARIRQALGEDQGENDADPSLRLSNAMTSEDWPAMAALAEEADVSISVKLAAVLMLVQAEVWSALEPHEDFLRGLRTEEAARALGEWYVAVRRPGDWLDYLSADFGAAVDADLPSALIPPTVDALMALGRVPEAFALHDSWAPAPGDRRKALQALNLALRIGDLKGAVRQLPHIQSHLGPSGRLQLAARLAAAEPQGAQALMAGFDPAQVSVTQAALAFDAAERARLSGGLSDAFQRALTSPEAVEAGIVRHATVEDVIELRRQMAESGTRQTEHYEAGDVPVHLILKSRLGRAFVGLLAPSDERPVDLFVRAAGRTTLEPVPDGRLVLDITSLITAWGCDLIGSMFKVWALAVAPTAPVALQALEADLLPNQPARHDAGLQVIAHVDAGQITIGLPTNPACRIGFLSDGDADASGGDVIAWLVDRGDLTADAAAAAELALGDEARARGRDHGPGEPFVLNAGVAANLAFAGLLDGLLALGAVVMDAQGWEEIRRETEQHAREAEAGRRLGALRVALADWIRDGEIAVLPEPTVVNEDIRDDAATQCLVDIVVGTYDAETLVCVEDRATSLHSGVGQAGFRGVIDVAGALLDRDCISETVFLGTEARLRNAGFRFLPITTERVLTALRRAPIEDGAVVETPELTALRRAASRDGIREDVLRVPPNLEERGELAFAIGAMRLFDTLFPKLWDTAVTPGASIETRFAWSDWLWGALRFESWDRFPVMQPDVDGRRAMYITAFRFQLMAGLFVDNDPEIGRNAYEWVWNRTLRPELELDPGLGEALARDFHDSWFGSDTELSGNLKQRRKVVGRLIAQMPDGMSDLMLANRDLSAALRPLITGQLTFGNLVVPGRPFAEAAATAWSAETATLDGGDGKTFALARDGETLTIADGDTLYRLAPETMALIAGAPEAQRTGVRTQLLDLGESEIAADAAAEEVAGAGDAFERISVLTRLRLATTEGRLLAIAHNLDASLIRFDFITPPEPTSLLHHLGWTGAPDWTALATSTPAAEALQRAATAPLWASDAVDALADEMGEEDRNTLLTHLSQSPLGNLTAVRLLKRWGRSDIELTEAIEHVVHVFETEGQAFIDLVTIMQRRADRDRDWAALDAPRRTLAMWAWADRVWRICLPNGLDPERLVEYAAEHWEKRPGDWLGEATSACVAASPWTSWRRTLVCGLAAMLGERIDLIRSGPTGDRIKALYKVPANTGEMKELHGHAYADDAALTWLSDYPDVAWNGDDPDPTAIAEAAASASGKAPPPTPVLLVGPFAFSEADALRLLDAVEREPEARTDGDILRLNVAEFVARRIGSTSPDVAGRLERVALGELRAARARENWARVRDNVIDRVMRVYLPLTGADGEAPSTALAARLHRLTCALSSQDEIETLWRATRFLLAATPFDQRRGLWDLHVRLRSRV